MACTSSPISPLVSASLHEGDTLLRFVLGRPFATVERQPIDTILTRRDGNEGISAYLERRKAVREDR
jgi:hypothetical protein